MDDVIGRIDIVGKSISHVNGFSETDYAYLTFCLEHKVITIHGLRQKLHAQLLRIGKASYDWLMEPKPAFTRYPDHCPSPVSLAYAIVHKGLTDREQLQIVFDHRETLEDFMREEREQLLTDILRQLTNPHP